MEKFKVKYKDGGVFNLIRVYRRGGEWYALLEDPNEDNTRLEVEAGSLTYVRSEL